MFQRLWPAPQIDFIWFVSKLVIIKKARTAGIALEHILVERSAFFKISPGERGCAQNLLLLFNN